MVKMWFWKKKKDLIEAATEKAISAIRRTHEKALSSMVSESRSAVHEIKTVGLEIRTTHSAITANLIRDMDRASKKFRKDIDDIMGAYMVRSLDTETHEFGEQVITPEFTDLDSRAVFANPYATPDPDFSAHFNSLEELED